MFPEKQRIFYHSEGTVMTNIPIKTDHTLSLLVFMYPNGFDTEPSSFHKGGIGEFNPDDLNRY